MIEKARTFCVKEGMIALWALIGLGIGIIAFLRSRVCFPISA